MLAAAGGAGLLEMDVNENPLRDTVLSGQFAIDEGFVTLPTSPGIGIDPDLSALEQWRVDQIVCT